VTYGGFMIAISVVEVKITIYPLMTYTLQKQLPVEGQTIY